ncbi:MAG: HlyD family efflux transporter periplasmic adaptor subunit [Eubacteriales bacterium]|nr:HlyD family efflux transporter periplasmic adaptor subunit [Eubacteriales bacterium]
MKIRKWITRNPKRLLGLCLFLAAVLLTAGAAAYTLLAQGAEENETVYKEETVQRGDLVRGVTESGSIALEESYITFDVEVNTEEDEDDEDSEDEDSEDEEPGYLQIQEVYAVSGQRIAEGDPLFSITQESYQAVVRKLEAALTEKEIALAQAQSEYNTSVLSARSTYDTSMLTANTAAEQLDATQTQLTEEINGLLAQTAVLQEEIDRCLEKLTDEDFKDSLEEALTAYEKAKETYEETDLSSPAAYSANYADYTSAKTQYENLLSQQEGWEETVADNQETILANQETILEKQGILEAKQSDAQNTYELSISGGELAADIYAYTKESLQSSVDEAQADVDEARETLEELNDFVREDCVVYADGEGMVTEVVYEAGDRLTQTGTMLTYVKTADYTVSVDVSEEDIADISIGDSVRVSFEAYLEEEYSGTVLSVTTTKTSSYAKTVSYPVAVRVEGDTQKLYGGMTAEITFVEEEVPDVLYVSRKAVVEQNGKTYVYVGDGEEKQLQEVQTGMENSTSVEITEGLSEGDVIYIRSSAG